MIPFLLAAVLNLGTPPPPEPANEVAAHLRSALQDVEHRFIDAKGGHVDYTALARSPEYAAVVRIAVSLQQVHPETLSRTDRLAFWLNTYNALVIHGIIEQGIPTSVQAMPTFFTETAYRIGGQDIHLDAIEAGVLSGNKVSTEAPTGVFGPDDPRRAWVVQPPDPRIHFGLVCGASSCPPIRFYTGERIESQLSLAAESFLNGSAVTVDPAHHRLRLSQIFQWYDADFGGKAGIRALLATYLDKGPAKDHLMAHWGSYRWEYAPYDWQLNQQTH